MMSSPTSAVKRLINRVSVDAAFFKKMSPMENLSYAARLYGMETAPARKEILAILEPTRLHARARLRAAGGCRAACSRRSRSPARC